MSLDIWESISMCTMYIYVCIHSVYIYYIYMSIFHLYIIYLSTRWNVTLCELIYTVGISFNTYLVVFVFTG